MANENSVVIGENCIKFYNEVLKISNISRTWIFRFQNIEKKKFEEQKRAYENAKIQYERSEAQKKKDSMRNILIGIAVSLVISVIGFSSESAAGGLLFLCIAGILGYVAFGIYKRDTAYPYAPPAERMFPEKFGLGIEMNSGYTATFTAIGDDGVKALSELQDNIADADVRKDVICLNLNEYNISVENNEGIINTGDFASNATYQGGKANS